MNQIFESSIVVRTLRWLARDSLVASAVRWTLRLFSRVDRAFARASADKDAQVDPARVHAMLRASWIVRAIDRGFSAPFAAWEHSRVRPFVDDLRAQIAAMTVPERIRLSGRMLAVALATRALLYVLSGASLTAPTLAVWGVVLAAALVLMSLPGQVAAGWDEWKRRKRS